MKKPYSPDEIRKDLDNILSKINALEVSAQDEYQKGIVKVLRVLVEYQIHTINEFEHIKKAIDLITLEVFDTKNKIKS
jgi:hypothetical protein